MKVFASDVCQLIQKAAANIILQASLNLEKKPACCLKGFQITRACDLFAVRTDTLYVKVGELKVCT